MRCQCSSSSISPHNPRLLLPTTAATVAAAAPLRQFKAIVVNCEISRWRNRLWQHTRQSFPHERTNEYVLNMMIIKLVWHVYYPRSNLSYDLAVSNLHYVILTDLHFRDYFKSANQFWVWRRWLNLVPTGPTTPSCDMLLLLLRRDVCRSRRASFQRTPQTRDSSLTDVQCRLLTLR